MITALSIGAASSAYNYTVVAKSGDVIDGITLSNLTRPFIADDGTVLFIKDYDLNTTCCSVLFSKHVNSAGGAVVVKQGDVIDGLTITQIFRATSNDSGEIVFSASFTGPRAGTGIFRRKAKVVATGDTIGGLTILGPNSDGQLNDSGEIVFASQYSGPNGTGSGLFTPNRVIVQNGTTIGGLTLTGVSAPVLSKNGTIAFIGGTNSFVGIFTQSGLLLKNGQTVSGLPLVGPLPNPAITELGVIGFGSNCILNGVIGIAFFLGQAVIAKTGDTIDGLTLSVSGDPVAPQPLGIAFNATGEAVFESLATTASGASTAAIFTQHHLVVQNGDTIAGFTVGNIFGSGGSFFFLPSINDSGQVAFQTTDASSKSLGTAIFVATPKGQ